ISLTAVADDGAEVAEAHVEVFGGERGVFRREKTTARTFEDCQQFHVFQQFNVSTWKVVNRCLLKITRQHRRISTTLTRRVFIRQEYYCFDIGVAVTNQLA